MFVFYELDRILFTTLKLIENFNEIDNKYASLAYIQDELAKMEKK